MSDTNLLTLTIDCHAYPLHLPDPDYPECGPDNLVRISEEYGILIREVPGLPGWEDWAWWYEVTGPRAHLREFLNEEYTGRDEGQTEELLDCAEPIDLTYLLTYTAEV